VDTKRVAIYTRISEDRDGTQTATARQLEDCQSFCERQHWQVQGIYEDIDVSAYKRGVTRPQFEAMLAAIVQGEIDGVVSWKLDRLCRRQKDIIRVLEATEQRGAFVVTLADSIDTRTVSGRAVAEIMTTMATMESESTSLRVKRAHQASAKAGLPSLGGTRAFGYSKDRKAILPEEATLVHEAANRVLAGEGLRGIALDWEARGIRTPTGGLWRATPLRRMLMSPMLAGLREYEGTTTEGTWPAILSVAEHIKVTSVLGDPLRRKSATNARSYLLSGFLRCGRCGSVLVARPRMDKVRRYVCSRGPGQPGCGGIARLAEPVEQVVVEAVFAALEGASLEPYLRKGLNGEEAAVIDAITGDEMTLEQLTRDHYVDKIITRSEFFSARAALTARLESNRARLASHRSAAVMTAVGAGAEVRKQWESRPLEWRRAILSAVIDHVVLLPAIKGLNRFDPELVEIVWRA